MFLLRAPVFLCQTARLGSRISCTIYLYQFHLHRGYAKLDISHPSAGHAHIETPCGLKQHVIRILIGKYQLERREHQRGDGVEGVDADLFRVFISNEIPKTVKDDPISFLMSAETGVGRNDFRDHRGFQKLRRPGQQPLVFRIFNNCRQLLSFKRQPFPDNLDQCILFHTCLLFELRT